MAQLSNRITVVTGRADKNTLTNTDTAAVSTIGSGYELGNEAGVAIPAFSSPNTSFFKEIQLPKEMNDDEQLRLLISEDYSHWRDAETLYPFEDTGSAKYGMRIISQSSTLLRVEFGGDGARAGLPWGSITANWKVIQVLTANAIGFRHATEDQPGTVSTLLQSFAGQKSFKDGIAVDEIVEYTNNQGVTVEGTLFKDGDVTITGNFYVNGEFLKVTPTEVSTKDNIIVLNDGEPGSGVGNGTGIAGIEVDRGTETNYQIIFDENDDLFKVGEIGNLQTIATRETSPTDNGVMVWNDTIGSAETSNKLTWDGTTLSIFNQTSGRIEISADNTANMTSQITASANSLNIRPNTVSNGYINLLDGNGDQQLSVSALGVKIGDNATAPRFKIKKLTGTFGQGQNVLFHQLPSTVIIHTVIGSYFVANGGNPQFRRPIPQYSTSNDPYTSLPYIDSWTDTFIIIYGGNTLSPQNFTLYIFYED